MKAVDREIRADVADLLVRYASGIDRRDWALLRSCFTDDCAGRLRRHRPVEERRRDHRVDAAGRTNRSDTPSIA